MLVQSITYPGRAVRSRRAAGNHKGVAMSTTTSTPVSAGTWNVDPVHSQVGFSVKHMGIANVRGLFREFAGKLELGDDISTAKISGVVKAASIDTGEPQRDGHLRSPDFFDADNNPDIAFESTRIEPVDEETFRVVGDLTMHGETHEVTLEAVIDGTETDPQGNDRLGLEVVGQLSRGDWGMKFNMALGSGNMMVSDKVKLALDVSAVRAS
jgi:polyisoprenoid-binding protein YceI